MRRRYSTQKDYPEGRLPLIVIGAFLMPLAVTFYGLVPHLQWSYWMILLAVVIVGFLEILCIVPLMTYVTDAFGLYSASAYTAVLMARCLMGTFLPLATSPLTEMLGYGYGFLILAGIALALALIPLFVMLYGARWRQRSKFTMDGAN